MGRDDRAVTGADPVLPRRRLLYVRAPGRHAELPPAHIRERSHALAYLFRAGAGEAQTQAALGVGLVGRPFGARIDGDTGRERGRSELQGVDLLGKLDPQKDAARRIIEFGRGPELLG